MPMWQQVEHRREGIAESVELAGDLQQALVEQLADGRIIVSLSLLAKGSVDDGKTIAERMLVEARRAQGPK